MVENYFPGSDFAAWASLSQVKSIRKARPLPISKQARTIQRIGNVVLPYKQGRSERRLQILAEIDFLGGNPVSEWDFERNYLLYAKLSSLQSW